MPKRSAPGRPTFTDVARKLGLSISAVSLVAKDPTTSRVSEATRQRILDHLGRPAPAPAAPLAMVVADSSVLAMHHIGELLAGAQARARALDRNLMVETWEPQVAERLARSGLAGLILALPLAPAELAEQQQHLPCVLLNQVVANADCDTIESDNRQGIRLAVEHLHANGHRRVAYLGYLHPGVPLQEWRWGHEHAERARGFHEAVDSCDGLRGELHLLTVRHHPGREVITLEMVLDGWLARADRPTAVVAFDDHLAIRLAKALRERGSTIPREVAVVGYTDLELARQHEPPLSSVDTGLHQMGAEAVDALGQRISGRGGAPRRILCRCRLEVRASSAFNVQPPCG